MRNDIQPKLEKIGEYFNRKEFYIPTYQRPYAWKVEQCEQLIEDIEMHKDNFDKESQDNYFFGAVLISQDNDDIHEVTLIDGQQRTTTFMLMAKALLMKVNKELGKLSEDSLEDAKLIDRLKELKDKLISMLYTLDEDRKFLFKRNNKVLKKEDIKYINDSVSEMHSNDLMEILFYDNFEDIHKEVKKIPRKQHDNKYTNFYKNFRYFYNYFDNLTNTQVRDFTNHFINYCQVITITSFNTDQAINIFNSLNGTGVPLTPIEVIVSKITAGSTERKTFEVNWQQIVKKIDGTSLDLNLLMTHYIFMKLSEQQSDRRNPGIRSFFKKNNHLLKDDLKFTDDLNIIIDNFIMVNDTQLGRVLSVFNGNIKPFISSYLYYRDDMTFIDYLLKIAALIEITDYSYSHNHFKSFLENINLKYSQTNQYTDDDLISLIKNHITTNFDKNKIFELVKESGNSKPLIYLNEYLYCKEQNVDFISTDHVDIEHIMPISGINRENIMKDAGCDTQDEFKDYAEMLGNKILLESEINRGIGDAWFRTKKENTITSGRGYIGSKYKIAQALVEYPSDTWTKEDIIKATEKAAERITQYIFE